MILYFKEKLNILGPKTIGLKVVAVLDKQQAVPFPPKIFS
jgi:hypothetical protein